MIGAIGVGDNVASPIKNDVGSVYVFTRSSTDGGTFTQQSKLHANDAAVSDQFGRSVSLHGDTALIGAWKDDDNSKQDSGSVYVFKAPPPPPPSPPPSPPPPPPLFLTSLVEYATQPKLHASDAAVDDYFGYSVSLYGDTALIGAINDDDNSLSASGSVYVFTRPSVDGTFTQQSKLHASDADATDHFGTSVSLYGDTALIGAYLDDNNVQSTSGSVYVFTRSSTDGGTFTQRG